MFDMGFTELLLIGIVGLIVIGPERLPGVARTAGKYFGKLRRFMSNVKADVENELRTDELRDILKKQQEELQSLKNVVDDVGKDVDSSVSEMEKSIDEAVSEANAEQTPTETEKNWTESIAPLEEADKPKPKAKAKAKTAKPKVASPKAAKPKPAKAKVKKAAAAK